MLFSEYTDDPCSNYSIIEYDFTRHEDFYYHSHMYVSHCDDFVSGGWNYFEGGYNLSTSPLSSGQCRSYSPIWINGKIYQTRSVICCFYGNCLKTFILNCFGGFFVQIIHILSFFIYCCICVSNLFYCLYVHFNCLLKYSLLSYFK